MPQSDEVAARQAKVLNLRAAGMTYQAIADQEVRDGGPERGANAVANDYYRAIRATKALDEPDPALLVSLEDIRLDSLQRTLETVVRNAARSGRCTTCGRTGDPELVIKTTDRVLRVMERRAAMHALDPKTATPGKPEDGPLDELRKRRDSKMAK